MKVFELSASDGNKFDDLIVTKPAFVRFHSPSCGHCISMKPEWDNLHSFLNDVNINIIDANVGLASTINHLSGKEVEGKGVPAMYFINGNTITEYSGERTAKAMSDFIKLQIAKLPMSGGRSRSKRSRSKRSRSKRSRSKRSRSKRSRSKRNRSKRSRSKRNRSKRSR